MLAGRIIKWDRWEMRCNGSGSGSGSGSSWFYQWGANAKTQSTPDSINVDEGFILEVSSSKSWDGATDVTNATFNAPLLGISEGYSTAIYSGSLESLIEIDDLVLYCDDFPQWYIKWGEIRWYVGGVLQYTGAADSLTSDGYLTPASIPLFGMPVKICATASATGPDVEDPGPWDVSASADVVGGSRFKDAGADDYTALAVTVQLLDAPGDCGLCSLEPCVPTDEADDTWNGHCTADNHISFSGLHQVGDDVECCDCPPPQSPYTECHCVQPNIWRKKAKEWSTNGCGACLWLFPNLAKAITRVNADYAAILLRAGFPYAKAVSGRNCMDVPGSGPSPDPEFNCSSTDEETWQARFTQFLETVLNAAGTIEDPLALTTYAPYSISGSATYLIDGGTVEVIQTQICETETGDPCPIPPGWISSCVPPDPPESNYLSNSYTSSFPIMEDNSTSKLLPALKHSESLPNYINGTCNPLWSYCLWFPPDGADESVQWPVDGSVEIESVYWCPLRTQWIYHPDLPSEENRLTRNSIVAEPLMNGQMASWLESAFFGMKTSWVGISRFIVQTETPADVTLDSNSSSLWSAAHASLSFGGTGVTITPDPPVSGSGEILLRLDVGSFLAKPYMLPHLCDRVVVDWVGTNIDSVSVDAIGKFGSSLRLGDSPGTYNFEDGSDGQYAGSWAQDFGQGVVDDFGLDIRPSGRSLAEMLDPEGAQAFGLLAGRQPSFIWFTVTLSDGESPATIKWPKFKVSADDGVLVQEQGHHSCMYWPDGPGIRFGQWTFYNSDTDSLDIPPTLPNPGAPPLGWHSSALDGLIWRRLVLQGLAADDGLLTELASLYDEVEGPSYAHVNSGTLSFLLPGAEGVKAGHLALVNSLSEVPPVFTFPNQSRGTDWQPTGGYSQTVYSYIQEPRRIISPNDRTKLLDPSNVEWTAEDTAYEVSGWKASKHSHVLDNSEVGFHVAIGTKKLAVDRPWDGWFDVWSGSPDALLVGYDVSKSFRHCQVYRPEGSDTLWLRISQNTPISFAEIDTGLVGSWGRPRFGDIGSNYIGLMYGDGAGIRWARTNDEGAHWSTPLDLGDGLLGDFDEGAVSGALKWLFKLLSSDGGTTWDVWMRLLDNQLNVVQDWQITNLTGVDESPIAVRESLDTNGAWRIGVMHFVSASVVTKYAPDGVTFS